MKAEAPEDPRFAAVVAAFAADRALAPIAREYAARKKTGGRKFGSNGLQVNGKLFAIRLVREAHAFVGGGIDRQGAADAKRKRK